MTSAAALGFALLVCACFARDKETLYIASPVDAAAPATGTSLPVALAIAFQAVIFTYDGWYGAIYFAEEDVNPSRNLPRAMIGAVLLVAVLYLLMNLGFLRVLSLSRLAASEVPAADAAKAVFGPVGGQAIAGLSLLSLVSVTNAAFMQTPRVLYAMSRDRLFLQQVATVNRQGTPTVALAIGSLIEILLVSIGSFETMLAMTSFFFVIMYMSGFAALFALRMQEPDLPRPFPTWGYPWSTAAVVVLSSAFLAGVIGADPLNSLLAALAIAASYPTYRLVVRGNSSRRPLGS